MILITPVIHPCEHFIRYLLELSNEVKPIYLNSIRHKFASEASQSSQLFPPLPLHAQIRYGKIPQRIALLEEKMDQTSGRETEEGSFFQDQQTCSIWQVYRIEQNQKATGPQTIKVLRLKR